MRIVPGIFAKTFSRPTLEEILDAVVSYGLYHIQFNLSCAGLPTFPDGIDPALIERIRRETAARGITMSAISGTYNMIHPDLDVRRAGLQHLRVLASACQGMGTSIITLCTGTRDPADMWRWHPDNASDGAWADLCAAMEEALHIAEDENVTLAFEPEQANVISSASRARHLLDTMHSPHLKVVIDPANLFAPDSERDLSAILDEAFALLGRISSSPTPKIGSPTEGLPPPAPASLTMDTIYACCAPSILPGHSFCTALRRRRCRRRCVSSTRCYRSTGVDIVLKGRCNVFGPCCDIPG